MGHKQNCGHQSLYIYAIEICGQASSSPNLCLQLPTPANCVKMASPTAKAVIQALGTELLNAYLREVCINSVYYLVSKKGVVGKAQTDFELCLLDTIEEVHQDSGETDSDSSMYGEEASTSLQLRLAVEDRSSSPAASGLLQVPQTPARRPAARLCTPQSERTFWRERDAEGWQEFLDEL